MQSALRGIIGILGFGVDGRAVAEFLQKQPDVTEVRVFDDADIGHGTLDLGATTKKISYVPSPNPNVHLTDVSLLFRSPGFRLTHPLVLEAKKRGIPIASSTTWFLKHFPGITVGITGSNGKTTCTSLIAEMLRAEFGKERVEEGGNDRVPRLDLLNSQFSILNSQFIVLELSSFQLIDCPVSPNVAVVLNVTPNHLDWHKDMQEYAEAKRQIVAHQHIHHVMLSSVEARRPLAILNKNDSLVRKFAEGLKSEVRWFNELSTFNFQLLTFNFKTHPDTICAAVTTARALGVSEENIVKVLQTFRGVPHRIEFIRELDSVKWYNDSSCTTPESAITACEAFPEGTLILLLGGRDKGMGFSRLYEMIQKRKVRVVPYGEMAETFEKHISTHYSLPTTHSFQEVIETARKNARAGDNIILSPACASFDMFMNAKERGTVFNHLIANLK